MRMGLGTALVASGGSGPDSSVLDMNFAAGQFRFKGKVVSDAEAIGGSVSPAGRLRVGPHLAPDAVELIPGGDFSGGIGGWGTSADPLQIVDGALQSSGNGGGTTNTYLHINPLIDAGRAYRLAGRVWCGTAGSVHLGIGAPVNTEDYAGSPNITATSATAVELHCGGLHESGALIVLRHLANPAHGTFYADDISLKEIVPFDGFVAGALAGMIEAVAPVGHEEACILFQADDDAHFNGLPLERNYIRLQLDVDGHLHFVVGFGGEGMATEVVDLDLGVVTAGARFAVVFSAEAGNFRAALVGRRMQSVDSGWFPGLAVLRFGQGRSETDGLWTGSIERARFYDGALSDGKLLRLAASNGIVAWGDSLTAGAGASSLEARYPAVAETLFDPPRGITVEGIGGQTSTQIAARMNARPIVVNVAGGVIPPSGSVLVTEKSIDVLSENGAPAGSQAGWLNGVEGVMSTDAAGQWRFTRTVPGEAVPVAATAAFVCERGEALRGRSAWLWLGRNGATAGYDVFDDIAAAVASLGHSRYLVGSVLVATDPDDPEAINTRLAARYSGRYVEVLGALMAAHDGSAADMADVAGGYVPRSLRTDAVHLTDAGQAIVANAFHEAHMAMGW